MSTAMHCQFLSLLMCKGASVTWSDMGDTKKWQNLHMKTESAYAQICLL